MNLIELYEKMDDNRRIRKLPFKVQRVLTRLWSWTVTAKFMIAEVIGSGWRKTEEGEELLKLEINSQTKEATNTLDQIHNKIENICRV